MEPLNQTMFQTKHWIFQQESEFALTEKTKEYQEYVDVGPRSFEEIELYYEEKSIRDMSMSVQEILIFRARF